MRQHSLLKVLGELPPREGGCSPAAAGYRRRLFEVVAAASRCSARVEDAHFAATRRVTEAIWARECPRRRSQRALIKISRKGKHQVDHLFLYLKHDPFLSRGAYLGIPRTHQGDVRRKASCALGIYEVGCCSSRLGRWKVSQAVRSKRTSEHRSRYALNLVTILCFGACI